MHQWHEIDVRMLLYYPFYFLNGFIDIHAILVKLNKKEVFAFVIAVLIAICIGYYLFDGQIYTSLNWWLRIVLDIFPVASIIGMSVGIDHLLGWFRPRHIRKVAGNLSKTTFCAYLFHRQFYEAEIMVIGKFSKLIGWLSMVALLIVSFVIQSVFENLGGG